jgi:molybdopterin synthase sulfur carrier subunit
MPNVVVRYMLAIRELVGVQEERFEINGSTLRDLLTKIVEVHGNKLENTLFDRRKERISLSVVVFVNGREARHLSGLDTKLTNGDQITVVPPSAGG